MSGAGEKAGGPREGEKAAAAAAPGEGGTAEDPPGAAGTAGAASAPRRAWAAFAGLSWRVRATLVALVVLVGAVLVAALNGHGALGPSPAAEEPAQADAVAYDGRSPRAPAGDEQRVLVALPRPALGDLPGARAMAPDRQRAYVASLEREARALRSALGARGVRLRNVVSFERVWNGFAATVRTRQLADLGSLGVRPQPVRRLYPALGEPVPAPRPSSAAEGEPSARRPTIAVLAGGVDPGPPAGSLVRGYDAVDRDRDPRPGPDPRGGSRTETSGTALASIVAAADARVMPIRVAALRAAPDVPMPEEMATSDTLLAGLEHAVDPNGDGATDDHVAVALVGVNAPYAGFAASPEAQAARGAAGLGTLVVAGAGDEGPAVPGSGTIGAPAAGADALAVGALAAPAVPHVALTVGGVRVRAALLGGRPPGFGLRTAGPLDTADLTQLLRPGATPLQGRLVVVRAGDNPPARAAAAAAAGARAVLLADPGRGPLAAMPAGRVGVPVLGVTGDAAAAVVRQGAGKEAKFGRIQLAGSGQSGGGAAGGGGSGGGAAGRGGSAGAARLSPFSSRGPAASGAAKPDLVAPGAAVTMLPGGGGALVGGTAVAAARVAAAAARLAAQHPDLPANELRTVLASASDPAGLPVDGAGAGVLRQDPAVPGLVVTPPRAGAPPAFRLRNDGGTPLALRLSAEAGQAAPTTINLRPGRHATARVTPTATPPPSAYSLGRLLLAAGGRHAAFPWVAAGNLPEAVPIGPLRLQRDSHGRVTGVRFTLGAFTRGDAASGQGTHIVLAERLELELLDRGRVVRRLTPPGGARELLPAEYGYTLQPSVRRGLQKGTYRFRAGARAPRQHRATVALSPPFGA